MNESAGKNDAGRRPGRKASLGRFLGRSLLLLVIAGIVLGLATLAGNRGDEPEPPSPGEAARIQAESSAAELAQAARLLSEGTQPGPARGSLLEAADLLQAQARALAPAVVEGSEPSPSSDASSTDGSPTVPAPTAGPPALPALVDGLADASRTNLERVDEVDPGMARLLASVGAGQQLLAEQLAASAQLPVPEAAVVPESAPVPDVAPPCQAATPQAVPAGGTLAGDDLAGDDLAGNALADVVEAERRTVYAYEVAAARLPSPAAESAGSLLAAHRTAAAEAADLAAEACLEVPAPQPGYALPAGFAADPFPGLTAAEDQLASLYADLAGLADGSARDWAAGMLLETARRHASWTGEPEALPGLDPAASGT